jgi:hypothetical protein
MKILSVRPGSPWEIQSDLYEVILVRNVLVLELGEDECSFSDGADLVGAGGDVA